MDAFCRAHCVEGEPAEPTLKHCACDMTYRMWQKWRAADMRSLQSGGSRSAGTSCSLRGTRPSLFFLCSRRHTGSFPEAAKGAGAVPPRRVKSPGKKITHHTHQCVSMKVNRKRVTRRKQRGAAFAKRREVEGGQKETSGKLP